MNVLILVFIFFYYFAATAFVNNVAKDLKAIKIKSSTQTYSSASTIELQGNVYVLVDDRLHIIADKVVIDKQKTTLTAYGAADSPVKVEDEQFLIFAEKFFINYSEKKGKAEFVKIHLDEGFVSADVLEKNDTNQWVAHHMTYTACDSDEPDWSISADEAVIHGGYFIKMKGLTFKIRQVPIFGLPRFIIPIQGHSKSGFLVPRFAVDYDYGFGIKQEYYKHISNHADSLFGIDWRLKKGVIFYNESRWARSKNDYTLFKANCSIIRDRFTVQDNKIEKKSSRGYWIIAKDYSCYTPLIKGYNFSSFMGVDFGTNKLNGYHFFSSTDQVDDVHLNILKGRAFNETQIISLGADYELTSRKQFLLPSDNETSSITNKLSEKYLYDFRMSQQDEQRVAIARIPFIHFDTVQKYLSKNFSIGQHAFFDHALFGRSSINRLFLNSSLFSQSEQKFLDKFHAVRFVYEPSILINGYWSGFGLLFKILPRMSYASNIKKDIFIKNDAVLEWSVANRGAAKLIPLLHTTLTLPTLRIKAPDIIHTITPSFEFDYVPTFNQNAWGLFDRFDRVYPTRSISALLSQKMMTYDFFAQIYCKQSYDFVAPQEIFPLRKSITNQHIMPFEVGFDISQKKIFSYGATCSYDWKKNDLLESRLWASADYDYVRFWVSYLFQKPSLQNKRELLSNIPHFLILSMNISLSDKTQLIYEGQFYASKKREMFVLNKIVPLVHKIRFDYQGHCWGCSIGFEEKRYRECGIGRNERAIVFSLKLDSLGSFANKIKGSRSDTYLLED